MASTSDLSKHDIEAAMSEPPAYDMNPNRRSPTPVITPTPPMLCGIRRKSMIITVSVGTFILILAIVVGVGAGIALKT